MKKILLLLLSMFFIVNAQEANLQKLPDLRLEMLDGKKTTLYSLLENGPLLIDFWATWCEPCKKEMVFLDAFHKEYSDSGFTVLTINQDSPRSLSKVRSFVRSKRYSFPVVKDPNKQIAQKMNVQVLPTTFLVDSQGQVVWQHVGYLPGDERDMEQEILKIIKR